MNWLLRQIYIGSSDKYEFTKKEICVVRLQERLDALAKAALAAGFSIETFSGHKDKSAVPPRATDLNSWESNAFKT